MNWTPAECKPGDIIRVRLGKLYHYGIFVSEEEVIQFGLPPTAENLASTDETLVLSTDIDVFSCGNIIETACPDRSEKKRFLPPDEIIRRARARLGTGGYNIIHNNCEHFVNECATGTAYSSQEEEARKRWLSRPICDIYISRINRDISGESVLPEKRRSEICRMKSESDRDKEKTGWLLLKEAALHSFHIELENAGLKRKLGGRWTAEAFKFSISITDNAAVVAVSNADVTVNTGKSIGNVIKHVKDPDILISLSGKNTKNTKFFLYENGSSVLLNENQFI